MLITGVALAALGFATLPLAEVASAGLRTSLLLTIYFLGYLGLTVWTVNTSPFLVAATNEQERSHAFSLSFVLSALGGFTGSLVAGLLPGIFATLLGSSLEKPAPYRYTLLSAGALLFTGIPLFAATGHSAIDPHQKKVEDKGKAPLALIAILGLVGLLSVSGEGTARTFFNVYLDADLSISASRIGAFSAVAQLLALLAALSMPLVAARVGKGRTILLGYVARALSLLPMAILPHWLTAGGGFIGVATFAGLGRPAFIAFHQESVPPRWRSAMSGAATMAASIGFASAALGGGYLAAAIGYRGLFLVGSVVSLAGALVFWARFIVSGRRVMEEVPA
jgi:Na+/melibiose symporter-like transporter